MDPPFLFVFGVAPFALHMRSVLAVDTVSGTAGAFAIGAAVWVVGMSIGTWIVRTVSRRSQ